MSKKKHSNETRIDFSLAMGNSSSTNLTPEQTVESLNEFAKHGVVLTLFNHLPTSASLAAACNIPGHRCFAANRRQAGCDIVVLPLIIVIFCRPRCKFRVFFNRHQTSHIYINVRKTNLSVTSDDTLTAFTRRFSAQIKQRPDPSGSWPHGPTPSPPSCWYCSRCKHNSCYRSRFELLSKWEGGEALLTC